MKKKFVEDRKYELDLIIQAKKGDAENAKEAMGKLLEYHTGLIHRLAKDLLYLLPTETIEEIVNEFSIFFIRCVGRFDPKNKAGAKFATYFRKAVYVNIWRLHNQNRSLIRIPDHICLEAAKILKVKKEMLKKIGDETIDEVAYEKLGIPKELGEYFLGIFNNYFVSLDSPVSGEDERTYSDLITNQLDEEAETLDGIQRREISRKIKSAISDASPTIQVFVEKYLSGVSQEQIVKDLCLPFDEVERIWRFLRRLALNNREILKLKKVI